MPKKSPLTATAPEATTEIAPETTVPQTTTAKQEQPTGYDVNGKVEAAKQESEKLTKQLTEEAVTQADMNQISYQISTLWNETLDYVWLALEDYVDEATWETLSKEQQEWTEKKLEEVANDIFKPVAEEPVQEEAPFSAL